MPAEWAAHGRCWMAWPCREDLWGQRIDAARQVYADVARAIARFEPVTMIARPELTASVSLLCGPGISVLPMPQDDSWTRDTCPSFLLGPEGARAGVAWRFNGWGEAYEDYAQDRQMARRVLDHLGLPRYDAPLVTEGGAFHVDGEGTCLACETSVLDPARNPGMSREEAGRILCDHLGAETVIWLPGGLVDDETGGHVDNLACFVRPGVVLAVTTEDQAEENHAPLQRNLEALRAARDARGRELEILPLPLPRRRARDDGRRLTLSYANFYLANGAVVMPAFDDGCDKTAYRTLAAAFPDREVVQVEATDILHGGGGIHCITQQEPAAA